jgi:hypothetical protein
LLCGAEERRRGKASKREAVGGKEKYCTVLYSLFVE